MAAGLGRRHTPEAQPPRPATQPAQVQGVANRAQRVCFRNNGSLNKKKTLIRQGEKEPITELVIAS